MVLVLVSLRVLWFLVLVVLLRYVAHRADLEAIATVWADFVPRIYEEYPQLLAEM